MCTVNFFLFFSFFFYFSYYDSISASRIRHIFRQHTFYDPRVQYLQPISIFQTYNYSFSRRSHWEKDWLERAGWKCLRGSFSLSAWTNLVRMNNLFEKKTPSCISLPEIADAGNLLSFLSCMANKTTAGYLTFRDIFLLAICLWVSP